MFQFFMCVSQFHLINDWPNVDQHLKKSFDLNLI